MKKKSILMMLLSFILAFSFMTMDAFASTQTPIFGHKYADGVGNIAVYVDYPSGAGYWEIYMERGMEYWEHTGWDNPIYFKSVSSNYGSNMDFYVKPTSFFGRSDNKVLALTRHFNSSGSMINPEVSDWMYAEIYLHDSWLRNDAVSNENIQGTVLHEMGHAFGLAHNNTNQYSIMCQTAFGRKVQRVQKIDNDAINRLY